ncbi:MAG: hypothetical protein PVG53_12820 [Holophagae bacterium]
MHAENTPSRPERDGTRSSQCRPRVVLFELAGRVRVEVIELPDDARIGDRLQHGGRSWTICGTRTGARVLIAEPEAN